MSHPDSGQLREHRIAAIVTRKIRTRWPRLLGRNAIFEEHGYGRELLVRQVTTDKGAAGWGICRNLPPHKTPDLIGRRLCFRKNLLEQRSELQFQKEALDFIIVKPMPLQVPKFKLYWDVGVDCNELPGKFCNIGICRDLLTQPFSCNFTVAGQDTVQRAELRQQFVGRLFEDLLAGRTVIRITDPDSDCPLSIEPAP